MEERRGAWEVVPGSDTMTDRERERVCEPQASITLTVLYSHQCFKTDLSFPCVDTSWFYSEVIGRLGKARKREMEGNEKNEIEREREVKVVRCEHFNRLKHSQLHLWAPKSPLHDQSTSYPLNPDGQNILNQVRSFKLNQSEVVQRKMYLPCLQFAIRL